MTTSNDNAGQFKPWPGETSLHFAKRVHEATKPHDVPLETSEDEARPYVVAEIGSGASYEALDAVEHDLAALGFQPGAEARKPIDANDLERMARERPDDFFLKGSGVQKLLTGIRQLEAEIRMLKAAPINADYWPGDKEAIRMALHALDGVAEAYDVFEYGLPLANPEQEAKLVEILQALVDKLRASFSRQLDEGSAAIINTVMMREQLCSIAADRDVRYAVRQRAANLVQQLYPDIDLPPPHGLGDGVADDGVAAIRTLVNLGYTWNGGELWKAPIGKKPDINALDGASQTVESLRAELDLAKASQSMSVTLKTEFIEGAVLQAVYKQLSQALTAAACDVLAERKHQQEAHGHTPEDDDQWVCDELAALACLYAMPPAMRQWDATSTGYGTTLEEASLLPDWKFTPGDRREELRKAGSLILAEMERMDRAAQKGSAA